MAIDGRLERFNGVQQLVVQRMKGWGSLMSVLRPLCSEAR
jgi:hypothetical protein